MRLDDAAKRVGVHPRTLRRAIDRGTLKGQQEKPPRGPWTVRWQDADRLYRQGPTPAPLPPATVALVPMTILNETIARYDEQTQGLRDQLAQQRGKVDDLAGQVADLRVKMAQAEAVLSWRGRRRLTRLQQNT